MVLNKVFLWGRLTADPELRQTQSGKLCTKVNVAVPRRKYGNEAETKTDFISVQVWNKSAEFLCKYFSKGSAVMVIGSIQNNNYTDKNGVKHYECCILADDVQFGESKPSSSAPAAKGESVQPVGNNSEFSGLDDFSDYEEIIGEELPY
ncbi:MAG: single-stranded DNA-binding protein [Oscillospiraceae bacterium]|nr:single-stranded DNA-binding protein [Oscillospiraceae bacterium]